MVKRQHRPYCKGNCKALRAASFLQIDTAVPYAGSYDDVVNRGQDEVRRGYEPMLKPIDVNMASYDVIAVGTPTWWYTMVPAVLTFCTVTTLPEKPSFPL